MAVEEMAAELPVCDSMKVYDSTKGMIEEGDFLGKERTAGDAGGW